jgi:hypothetical protein
VSSASSTFKARQVRVIPKGAVTRTAARTSSGVAPAPSARPT